MYCSEVGQRYLKFNLLHFRKIMHSNEIQLRQSTPHLLCHSSMTNHKSRREHVGHVWKFRKFLPAQATVAGMYVCVYIANSWTMHWGTDYGSELEFVAPEAANLFDFHMESSFNSS